MDAAPKGPEHIDPLSAAFHAAHCSVKHLERCRVGPTSRRKCWMLLVDRCYCCGHLSLVEKVEEKQRDWVIRSNRKIAQSKMNLIK